jgi:hypothetical protein
LLEGFGHNRRLYNDEDNEDDEVYSNVKKFVQTMVYNGKEDETLVETRVRLYKALNRKPSRLNQFHPTLIPSAKQFIEFTINFNIG